MDPYIDGIVPTLLKKAADTNAFIAEEADKALAAACTYCSDQKVFNCLQTIGNVKSNSMKVKLAMCYNTFVEKLGPRAKQFRDIDRVIMTISNFLSEGAIEVRTVAKIGLLTLKQHVIPQADLERLLMRAIHNERQYEKVKQILDRGGDIDSMSNYTNTKYGSIRGSSMDSRSAGPTKTNSFN